MTHKVSALAATRLSSPRQVAVYLGLSAGVFAAVCAVAFLLFPDAMADYFLEGCQCIGWGAVVGDSRASASNASIGVRQ